MAIRLWSGRRGAISGLLVLIFGLSTLTAVAVPASAASLPMVGSQWAVTNLVGTKILMTRASTMSSGGVEFPFPDAAGSPAGYALLMMTGFSVSLASSNMLTATFDVAAPSGNVVYIGNPNGGCPSSSSSLCPGNVRLYIQANLPSSPHNSCGVGNVNEFNFWWSAGFLQFTSGPTGTTLTVAVDPAQWSDLCGQFGSVAPTQFASAMAHVKYLGLSFGSGFFFENGVGVDFNAGTASFQLTSYTIS